MENWSSSWNTWACEAWGTLEGINLQAMTSCFLLEGIFPSSVGKLLRACPCQSQPHRNLSKDSSIFSHQLRCPGGRSCIIISLERFGVGGAHPRRDFSWLKPLYYIFYSLTVQNSHLWTLDRTQKFQVNVS